MTIFKAAPELESAVAFPGGANSAVSKETGALTEPVSVAFASAVLEFQTLQGCTIKVVAYLRKDPRHGPHSAGSRHTTVTDVKFIECT